MSWQIIHSSEIRFLLCNDVDTQPWWLMLLAVVLIEGVRQNPFQNYSDSVRVYFPQDSSAVIRGQTLCSAMMPCGSDHMSCASAVRGWLHKWYLNPSTGAVERPEYCSSSVMTQSASGPSRKLCCGTGSKIRPQQDTYLPFLHFILFRLVLFD